MLVINKATIEDIPYIAILEKNIFTDAWSVRSLTETFSQDHTFIIVAKEHGQLKGYCIISLLFDEAELLRIAVERQARRTGIGDLLMTDIFRQCKEQQIHRIVLEVRVTNKAATAFYRKHKFVIFAIRKMYYHNPEEDGLMMENLIG
ncbi:MAG: ribosomal protein S18-alanine N-acetyltransferase [Lachnospiraceae bacterium]